MSPSGASPAVELALGRSRVLNDEAMDKVHPILASSFNEWGETVAWPASRTCIARAATEIPMFIDALCAGLIPPFSAFFNMVLEHYQIHMVHLDPQIYDSSRRLRLCVRSHGGHRSFGGSPPSLLLIASGRPSAMLGVCELPGRGCDGGRGDRFRASSIHERIPDMMGVRRCRCAQSYASGFVGARCS